MSARCPRCMRSLPDGAVHDTLTDCNVAAVQAGDPLVFPAPATSELFPRKLLTRQLPSGAPGRRRPIE
jgi:hypothetical protein